MKVTVAAEVNCGVLLSKAVVVYTLSDTVTVSDTVAVVDIVAVVVTRFCLLRCISIYVQKNVICCMKIHRN